MTALEWVDSVFANDALVFQLDFQEDLHWVGDGRWIGLDGSLHVHDRKAMSQRFVFGQSADLTSDCKLKGKYYKAAKQDRKHVLTDNRFHSARPHDVRISWHEEVGRWMSLVDHVAQKRVSRIAYVYEARHFLRSCFWNNKAKPVVTKRRLIKACLHFSRKVFGRILRFPMTFVLTFEMQFLPWFNHQVRHSKWWH